MRRPKSMVPNKKRIGLCAISVPTTTPLRPRLFFLPPEPVVLLRRLAAPLLPKPTSKQGVNRDANSDARQVFKPFLIET